MTQQTLRADDGHSHAADCCGAHADGHDHAHGHDHPHAHGASCHGEDGGRVQIAAPPPGATVWKVGGMDCASCATTITTALGRMPGISDIHISITNETLTLALDESRTTAATVEQQIGKLGYTAERVAAKAVAQPIAQDKPRRWWSERKMQVALTAGLLLAVAYAASLLLPQAAYGVFVAASLIAAVPIARRAIMAAIAGAPFTIEMLMTIAVVGALVIGAAEEAAVVVFLFSIGEVLEGVAANRARAGIKALGALIPQTALVENAGGLKEVPAASLAPGDIVVVRPGDRVPADGTVEEGTSSVDESPITGESVPKSKAPGAEVFAGSINQDAALKLRVTRAAKDNMIARIVALVEEAQEAKAPTERFIDRFARLYMPFIVGLAILVAAVPPLAFGGAWNEWLYRGLTLLLIGCPCALVISVPAAIASGLAAGARHGLLVKGGAILETLARIQAVAFDKTGTLTEGRPAVTDVIATDGRATDLVAMAAAVERHSNHPLAKAIVARADRDGAAGTAATAVRAVAGKGMEGLIGETRIFIGAPRFAAERASLDAATIEAIARLEDDGKTVTVVVADGAAAGLIALRDEPRRDAAAGIGALKGLGVGAVMLTGDNARTGSAIARLLGIEVRAEMLPADKAVAVKEMAAIKTIAMVGDGINDAPALASAHVGIAMGSGTDVALEAADAALLKNDVGDVAALVRLARATMANIHQNIGIALALKAIFLVTTVTGATGLWMAIVADTGGTVLVTLNALRLLGHFRQRIASPTAAPQPAMAAR
ncbi:heavy metal translocating P-type ATPase [Chelatococcus sp. GCM10030263]|uniref:heavy metal translocating P-type ATPase n=1 Tax=Chelatococcus sp. GCM10030263 TaxID=3273387 RepID=UPI00362432C6